MATATREHLKQLIDELPEEAAADLERVLVSLVGRRAATDWYKLSASAFANWFEEGEYVYSA